MARHSKGSTPKLTEDLIHKFSASIRNGCYVETSAALCGISKDTLYRWLRLAQAPGASSLLRKLSDAVEKAQAEAEIRDLSVIDAAAQSGVWQAAAWRLERKHPERWGRHSKFQLEHSGPKGNPIEISAGREHVQMILVDPEALSALEILEARLSDENEP